MQNNLVFGVVAVFAVALFACDDPSGGGRGGTASSSSNGTAGEGGKGGSGGMGGMAGMAGMGGANVGGAAGMGGGGLPVDAKCGQSANGAMCAQGFVCCYPCGIPGCDWKCTQPCDPNSPGCSNGCMLVP